jgi:hypothetical protein
MFRPLGEIYSNPAILEATDSRMDLWRAGGAERLLAGTHPLGTIATAASLVDHLEALPLNDNENRHHNAVILLKSLPGDVLVNELGIDTAAWTYANVSSSVSDEACRDRIAEALAPHGYKQELLNKSKLLAHRERQPATGRSLLMNHEILDRMIHGALDHIAVEEVLSQNIQPGITIKPNRLSHYGLIPLKNTTDMSRAGGRIHDWRGKDVAEALGLYYDLFIDTPVGAALTHDGLPQARMSLAARGDNGVEIQQWQRCFGIDTTRGNTIKIRSPGSLVNLDWQNIFATITAELAATMGKDTVCVRAGRLVALSIDSDINCEKARREYDDQADRLGFKPSSDGSHWYKPIADILGQ